MKGHIKGEAYIDIVATYLFLCRSKRTVSANGDQIMHPFLSSKVLSQITSLISGCNLDKSEELAVDLMVQAIGHR